MQESFSLRSAELERLTVLKVVRLGLLLKASSRRVVVALSHLRSNKLAVVRQLDVIKTSKANSAKLSLAS